MGMTKGPGHITNLISLFAKITVSALASCSLW